MNSMNILVILPVKSLVQSKSRLTPVLNLQQRESFALDLLKRTLTVLKSSRGIGDILLVSWDMRVYELAERKGVHFLQEEGMCLNQALKQATQWSIERHFSSILILPLDVPFLEKEDIESMVMKGENKEEIVIIAPDQENKGTNALFVEPPGILEYRFGRDSFRRHWQQAIDRQIEIQIYHSPGIGFDVDSPSHYRSMLQRGLPRATL